MTVAPPAPPYPATDGLTGEYYRFVAAGHLHFQRCSDCRAWRHLPRLLCPECRSFRWAWERSSGRGRVYTWTVLERSLHEAFTELPIAPVVVTMFEGVRLVSWVVDRTPAELHAGLEVGFDVDRSIRDRPLPVFRAGDPT